ncbi:MAG: GTP-binding protein [Gammaproteobacteria bacterium]|nr:GTP-binding protein [Gammaproteobacteria bacterium]NNF62062.1 GTP-binding protein [Gammaproteobacteria bacterium]NNM20673.1 GTP-binding protein [Gammaproteobacteria bacterium]
MTQQTRKVCIIGDFAVGKTSTVARFVHNVFSDKYLTTVGVKIDTRKLSIDDQEIKLIIWDIAGTDRFSAVEFSYLRGASGYLVVIDGTRGHTADVAERLVDEARERYGDVPKVFLVNKSDLQEEWEISDERLAGLRKDGKPVFITSAKNGANVDEAIHELARQLVTSE